jgi:hypothetical protein
MTFCLLARGGKRERERERGIENNLYSQMRGHMAKENTAAKRRMMSLWNRRIP